MINGKVLIIGPAWLGDMVMAQALFKHLKMQDQNIEIHVAAPSWSFSLLERMPEVCNRLELNFMHGELALVQRYQFGKALRMQNYDVAIVLPNSWKSALIPWFAKIPRRIGWQGEMRFGLLNDLRKLPLVTYAKLKMVERYVALAYEAKADLPKKLHFPQLTVDLGNLERSKFKFSLKINNKLPILALGIGAAFGDAKCWPEDYFAALAYIAATSGKFNVWIFGTNKNLSINTSLPNIVNFSGKTSLLETVDLLSLANIVVCNDSGLMHIAASLNKKIIAIYGSTSEQFTPPLATHVIVVNKKLACSPCFARICPLQHHNCMRQITVEEVFEHVQAINNL